jgi:hypothetical protein
MVEKFKAPKPNVYSGDNAERDAAKLDTWTQKVKDYLALSGVTDEQDKILVLQYFLSGTAEEFYHTKRLEGISSLKDFLTELKAHIIPATEINRYWDDWYKISQVRNGRVERINNTAIRLEKVAARLGTAINNQVKIQRFLDAMHPELRYAVEPEVKDRSTAAWKDVKELANRKDDGLFQAGRYGRNQSADRTRQPHSSNATFQPSGQARPYTPGRPNNNKQVKRLTDNEKAQLRREKKCFYCKKPGHFFNECRARQRNQQSGKWVQSAHTTVALLEDRAPPPVDRMPPTVEDFIEAARTEPTKKDRVNNMVTNMNVNGHQARVLLDTGTTGTNLMSSSWAQTHNINTRELPMPITIHMAAKGSKTNANRSAHANVEIKQGTTERAKFLIVAISSYDVILGMPFLQDNQVALNTADSTAYFPKHNVTIQCATKQFRTLATSAVTGMDPTWPRQIPDDSAKVAIRRIPILADSAAMEPEPPHIPRFDKMFPTVFPEKEPEGLPPLRHGCNHIIRLDQEKLDRFTFHSRRIPDAYRKELIAHLANWKSQGIARPGPGRFPCSIFGVPKADPSKGWRWVNDLRDRNSITERDYTPLPHADNIREDAARANFTSLLDLSNAYHQVRVEPSSEELNVINADDLGSFQIKVMLQGDCNAPATMMRCMNTILGEFIGKFVWVYLDDILIFSDTRAEHLQHLSQVFNELAKAHFFLKMEKCQFLTSELRLLGHIIKDHRIYPEPERLRKIEEWRKPTTKKQLQSFLGVINYVAPHLFHTSTVLAPLTELTGKVEWRWDALHERAFDQIKDLCRQNVPLTPINYDKVKSSEHKVFLITDASRVGAGAFLCHGINRDDAKSKIAAIHSRRFTATQENYHTTDQELLAIVDALQAFETKLLGIRFTILTDHKALEYLVHKPIRSGRLARWLEYVQMFDFHIEHTPGQTNQLADTLSRLYEDEEKGTTPTGQFLLDNIKSGNSDSNNALFSLPTTDASSTTTTTLRTTTAQPHSTFYSSNAMPPYRSQTSSFRPKGPSRYARCDPSLHWSHCLSRDGCPYHHETGFMETFSTYRSNYDYQRQFRDSEIDWNDSESSSDSDSDVDMDDLPYECPDPEVDPVGNYSEWLVAHEYIVFKDAKRAEPTPSPRIWDPASGAPRPKFPAEREPNAPCSKQSPEALSGRLSSCQNTPDTTSNTTPDAEQEKSVIELNSPAGARRILQPGSSSVGDPTRPLGTAATFAEVNRTRAQARQKTLEKARSAGEQVINQNFEGEGAKQIQPVSEEAPLFERPNPSEVDKAPAIHQIDAHLRLPPLLQNTDLGRKILPAIAAGYADDPMSKNGVRKPFRWFDDYIVLDDPSITTNLRVYVPEASILPEEPGSSLRRIIINSSHKAVGHQSSEKSYIIARQNFYWPSMKRDFDEFCRECLECQRTKHLTTKPPGEPHILDIPLQPWESIAIDFLGPFVSCNGYKNIMVIMDRFSSAIILIPLKEAFSSKDVADAFLIHFYARHGLPKSIVSDRDPRFTSHFWQGLHRQIGIDLLMATSFHQNTNGQLERANRTIGQMLRIFIRQRPTDWARHLWRVENAFNQAPTSTMQRSPHEIQFGHVPRLLPLQYDCNVPAVNEYLEQQRINNAIARDALLAARYRQADIAAKRRNPQHRFKVGQYVFYKKRSFTKGSSRKLEDVWEGPYQITQIDSSTGNCKLALPKNKRVYPVFATDKLKLFHGDPSKATPPPSLDHDEEQDDTLYNIDKILDHKKVNGKDWWYIKWENYGPEDNSWEPDENVRDVGIDAIIEFLSERDPEYTSTAVTLPPEFFFPSDESFCSSDSENSLSSLSDSE